MYGFSAFAQSSFAALGGTYYTLTRTEALTSGDAYVDTAAFIASLTPEGITSTDTNAEIDVFYEGVVEGISQADSSTQTSKFYFTDTEGTTIGDVDSVTAQFSVADTENLNSADTSTQVSAFLESIAENIVSADTSTQVSAFLESIAENLNPADAQVFTAQFQEAITEALTVNNTDTETYAFYFGVIEAVASADQETIASVYFFTPVEALTSADSSTVYKSITYAITENAGLADTETLKGVFFESITEALIALDSSIPGGWNTIDDTQNAQWDGRIVTITGYGLPGDFLFSMAPVSGPLSNTTSTSAPVGVTPVISWNNINDTQNPLWDGVVVTITAWGIPGDMMLGSAPIAGQLINQTTASQPVGVTPVIIWQDIVDTNTSGWTFINDTQ